MGRKRKAAPGLGERLESLVPEGHTIAEFAAALGVSDRTIGTYFRGESEPSASFLQALHRHLDVDINWLLTGDERCEKPQAAAAHRLDPVILSRLSQVVATAHKKAGIRLPPEALVREIGALYNEMLGRVDDPTDAAEMQALLPWAEARLTKRLAQAVAKPGSGKRSA